MQDELVDEGEQGDHSLHDGGQGVSAPTLPRQEVGKEHDDGKDQPELAEEIEQLLAPGVIEPYLGLPGLVPRDQRLVAREGHPRPGRGGAEERVRQVVSGRQGDRDVRGLVIDHEEVEVLQPPLEREGIVPLRKRDCGRPRKVERAGIARAREADHRHRHRDLLPERPGLCEMVRAGVLQLHGADKSRAVRQHLVFCTGGGPGRKGEG